MYLMTKIHINLTVDHLLWRQFLSLCRYHKNSASETISQFMAATITKANTRKRKR